MVKELARLASARLLILPTEVGGDEETHTYYDLIDGIVARLKEVKPSAAVGRRWARAPPAASAATWPGILAREGFDLILVARDEGEAPGARRRALQGAWDPGPRGALRPRPAGRGGGAFLAPGRGGDQLPDQ